MSIIDTLSLRNDDPVTKLTDALNDIASNPNADRNELLWGKP